MGYYTSVGFTFSQHKLLFVMCVLSFSNFQHQAVSLANAVKAQRLGVVEHCAGVGELLLTSWHTQLRCDTIFHCGNERIW